jgi:hypothetical protein
MSKNTQPLKIRSANLQDGIDYEVKREIANMKISKKVAEMMKPPRSKLRGIKAADLL